MMSKNKKSKLFYPTTVELDKKSIAHNFRFFRKQLQSHTHIMAMIKASAYGNGAVELGRLIEREKLAEYLAVAYVNEGIELRNSGVKLPIVVLNPQPENFGVLIENCLEPGIHHLAHLKAFDAFLKNEKIDRSAYPVHLKLNSGMNRLGMDKDDLSQLIRLLKKSKGWEVRSIMTHLSASGTAEEDEFSLTQLQEFEKLTDQLIPYLPEKTILHALNSNGIYRFPNYRFQMVRLGIGMYGASPLKELRKQLKPISKFKTHIAQVRSVQKGDSIGYSRAGVAIKDGYIATLSVGYADGFSRSLGKGNWQVEIQGKLYPTIGNICMDLCMIDLGGDKLRAGEEVLLFGGKKSIHEYAEALGTITYEAMCRIGPRVVRILK